MDACKGAFREPLLLDRHSGGSDSQVSPFTEQETGNEVGLVVCLGGNLRRFL